MLHKKAENVASFVKYEWDMFNWISQQPIEAMPGDSYRNLLVEGLLLHSRVLRDFLTWNANNPNDVWAGHFFDDEREWTKRSAGLCPYLIKERVRLNKALIHLSYSRIQYEENKAWDLERMIQEIKEAWSVFWKALPEDRKKWFDPRKASNPVAGSGLKA